MTMSIPRPNLYIYALAALATLVHTITKCHSFSPTSSQHRLIHQEINAIQRRSTYSPRSLFKELISDADEDLRADIAVIKKQEGLDEFLNVDNRVCVIKLFAPYCKACRAFGNKFRKLATEKGDRMNAAGEAVYAGDARFGQIDYASNIKLCKMLGVKKFPTVLIYRGGEDSNGVHSEIICKQSAIEDIVAEMDRLVSPSGACT